MMEALPPFSAITLKQKTYVRECVDVLVDILTLYGFDTSGWSRKGTYDHWIKLAGYMDTPMKMVKWKIGAFFSVHVANLYSEPSDVQPAACAQFDNPGVLLGGRAYRFIRRLSRGNKEDFLSFITSVLYSKKGMPRPTKIELKLAEKSAFGKLTSPPPPRPRFNFLTPWGDLPAQEKRDRIEHVLCRDSVEAQIVRTVRELFNGVEYTQDDRVRPFVPSTSANYINTRSLGGALGHIVNHPSLLSGLRPLEGEDPLVKIESETVRAGNRAALGAIQTLRANRLKTSFSLLYRRMCSEAFRQERAVATPLALPEALKTRVITKGPPLLYTVLKPLQRKLWSVLKSHPCFKLVGQVVSESYLQDRMSKTLRDNEFYLSVDYSDATNELHSWCSNYVVRELSNALHLNSEERAAFHTAMTKHIIEYAKDERPQKRGQLMGSIVSFPVLCIVNAAICRWALEIGGAREYTLSDAPLMVNGDDALLRTCALGKESWTAIASFCGLAPSPGKVYTSRHYVNINSTSFERSEIPHIAELRRGTTVNGSWQLLQFKHIHYVNLGLLKGLKRSGEGKEDDNRVTSVGARCRDLIRTSPPELRERVLKTYLHKNKSSLQKFHIPWFVPEQFGGLGLPEVGRFKLDWNWRCYLNKVISHPKKFPVPPMAVNCPWKIWKYACSRVPEPSMMSRVFASEYLASEREFSFDQVSSVSVMQARALCCVESIFTAKDLKSLYDSKASSDYTKRMRALQNLWSKVVRDKDIPLIPTYTIPFHVNTDLAPAFTNIPATLDDSRDSIRQRIVSLRADALL